MLRVFFHWNKSIDCFSS